MRRGLIDRVHKAVVATCFATTVVGTCFLLYNAGYFVTRVLPERRAVEEREAKELLKEGLQSSADNLPDIAPTLRG